MKLAYHGATGMKSDLATDVAAASRAGFRALEIWVPKMDDYLTDHSPSDMKALFRDADVEPASISSIEFIGFRGDESPVILERCEELCSIARLLGCPTLVLVPSPTPQARSNTVLDLFFPWEKIKEEYVGILRSMSPVAAAHGVRLSFEFLGFPWCSVRTPRGAMEIIEEAGGDNLGINFDACHFYGGGAQLDEIDAIDPSRIFTFHLDDMEDVPKEAITDGRRLLPGLGVVPLDDICSRLRGIGYDGLCSVELFRAEYWDWDPYELAARARETAIGVLSPHFQLA